MDGFAKDLVSVLQYLLPGFVSAWVFPVLTIPVVRDGP